MRRGTGAADLQAEGVDKEVEDREDPVNQMVPSSEQTLFRKTFSSILLYRTLYARGNGRIDSRDVTLQGSGVVA